MVHYLCYHQRRYGNIAAGSIGAQVIGYPGYPVIQEGFNSFDALLMIAGIKPQVVIPCYCFGYIYDCLIYECTYYRKVQYLPRLD